MEKKFLTMIQYARTNEEVMLYNNILDITENELNETIKYLETEYKSEALSYPFTCPCFDSQAAIWGAKTFYTAAQLLLYRENKPSDLQGLLPPYGGEITAGAILSADLLMRFVPDIVTELKLIDMADDLISVLEDHLQVWHYSGITYLKEYEHLDFGSISSNDCLKQMYVNRVIENKNIRLANHPSLKSTVEANLGIFGNTLWSNFQEYEIDEYKTSDTE